MLLDNYYGVLSTLSVEMTGYPFGSVVPYVLDAGGRPVILIADIAQHTRNIAADPRVSLLVLEHAEDVQAAGRLTLLAEAQAVPLAESDTAERYYEYFPDSRDFHLTHGFRFVRLNPVRGRYIGGFGRIHWLPGEQVRRANPFAWAEQRSMIEHMNRDHVEAMRGYCRLAGVNPPQGLEPALAGVDGEGFHLRLGARIVRVAFSQPVDAAAGVRAEMVALSRRAAAT